MTAAARLGRAGAAALIAWTAGMAWTAAAGCSGAQRTEPLGEAVQLYNEGIRWGRTENAAARVPAERRDDFLDDRDRLAEDLRIESYEVIRVRFDATQTRARVQVKYSWYLDSAGILHTTHVVQTWEQRGKLWFLTDEAHLRGEPMPGVPEPDEPEPGAVDAGAEGEPDAPEPGAVDAGAEGEPDAPEGPESGARGPVPGP